MNHSSQHRSTRFDALQAEAESQGPMYATLDLANLRRAAAPALARLKNGGALCLLGDQRPEAELASPWLVPVSQAHAALLPWTIDLATRHSAVTWISSALPLPALASRLGQRADVLLPDGERALLRFFDPRVLPALHQTLDDAQRRAFFSLGTAWLYPGRKHTLERIDMRPAEDITAAPLRLSDTQFGRMLRSAEVDCVMPELVKQVPQRFLRMPAGERIDFTDLWLERADALNLEQHPDRVALCVLAASLGDRFHETPPWIQLLADVRAGHLTLAQAIEQAEKATA